MGMQSIVYGAIITCTGNNSNEYKVKQLDNERAIAAFTYDEKYPFNNIFWANSPAQYFTPVIGFAGSYKQVEEHWSEWLWKFSELLSTLDAFEATVHLECVRGRYLWRLRPISYLKGVLNKPLNSSISYKGEQWVIVESPPNDFTLSPRIEDNKHTFFDPVTGHSKTIVWDKFVERWE